jgi:Tol biopolymer transport system component
VKENEGIMNRIFPPPGRLTLLDLRTKQIRNIKAMRDSQIGGPIWSNSGLKIAVTRSTSNTKEVSVTVLDPYTGALEKEIFVGSDDAIYLDSWTPDDRSLLFHTLSALYEVHVDTGLVEKLDARAIFKLGEISSATRFHFSLDRRYLLFDKIIDTSNGPESEVSLLDLTSKTVRRVTPQGIRGRAAVWLPSNKEILFSRVEWREEKWRSDICRIALDGSGLTTLARDADLVSFAMK